MLQKVIDYEFNIVQQKVFSEYPVTRSGMNTFKYTPWKLHQTIQKIPQNYDYNLIWVGNDKSSHICAFFYCVILGSLQSTHKKDEGFLKLKYNLYQLSEQYLSIEEQKQLVQNICLLQYSKSLTEFLRRTQAFQDMLSKLLYTYTQQTYANLLQSSPEPFQQLKSFSNTLDFINYEIIDQKIARIIIKNSSFYLIEELNCYFVMEEKNMSPVKRVMSQSNEQLIYQTYRKRSSKKTKNINSPQSPKSPSVDSPFKYGLPPPNYSTPKFYINHENNLINNKVRNSNEINVAVFKEESSDSEGHRKRKEDSEEESNLLRYVSINPGSISPQHKLKMGSLGSSNVMLRKNIIKGEDQRKNKKKQSRIQTKENYNNPEMMGTRAHRRDKTFYQSLGANDDHFRRSIPFMNQVPRQKRSVPKFILDKQKNSRKMSPPDKNHPLLRGNIGRQLIKPRISSKVFVNNNILASPVRNQYLFTYFPK